MMEDDFSHLLDHWKKTGLQGDLPSKLSNFSSIPSNWAGSRFSQLPRKISNLLKERNRLLHSNLAKDNINSINSLETEIEKLVVQEEVHWKQRARANWLAHGDGNTKLFHEVNLY